MDFEVVERGEVARRGEVRAEGFEGGVAGFLVWGWALAWELKGGEDGGALRTICC